MALTLEMSARNASVNARVDLIDAAATPGKLQILADDDAVLVEITLGDPAFGDAILGAATASGLPISGTGTAAAGAGTSPTKYNVCDGDGNVAWRGTIPGNLLLDAASIAVNQIVNVTSWGHGQPAS